MENVYIIADYHKIFGENPPELSDVLGDDVHPGMLATLSMLSWKNRTPEINEWVEKNIPLTSAGLVATRESDFSNRTSCMWLWLYLIKNLRKYNFDHEGEKDQFYEKIIRCLTILNKKEHNKEDTNGYLMNNGYGFYRDNYYWQINRSMRSFVYEKKMKTYVSNFQKHYNVKLTDYIELHSFLTRRFSQGATVLASVRPSVWVIDLDVLAQETRLNSEELERIMMMSSFSIDDFRNQENDFNKEDAWHDFLRTYPYFRLSEKKYIPINGKLAENLLYNELFHKIKYAAPSPLQFMTDYGLCFESYISDLIKLACRKSKFINYKYLPEFKYDSNSKRSSDAYIYFRDEVSNVDVVIVIEVKAKRIREQARIVNPTEKDIQLSIDKTIRDPLSQALGVTCDIINKQESKILKKDKVYYFMSVSMDGYTSIFGDYDLSLSPKHHEEIKLGGVYPVTIEGFECFMRVLMSNYSSPANIILNDFNEVREKISFKTHVARISNSKRCLSEDFDNYINKSLNMTVNNFAASRKNE